jgi:hypothetical protein
MKRLPRRGFYVYRRIFAAPAKRRLMDHGEVLKELLARAIAYH